MLDHALGKLGHRQKERMKGKEGENGGRDKRCVIIYDTVLSTRVVLNRVVFYVLQTNYLA